MTDPLSEEDKRFIETLLMCCHLSTVHILLKRLGPKLSAGDVKQIIDEFAEEYKVLRHQIFEFGLARFLYPPRKDDQGPLTQDHS